MKKITLGDVIISTVIVLFIIVFGLLSQHNVRLKQERQELKDEIQELNREIGEYQAMDSFWEDYMDLLDEIYQGKINEAVLEERIYWLDYNNGYEEDYVQQMYDTFEDLIEVMIEYYETTTQEVSLETYVAQNYPSLYDRVNRLMGH